jgi:flagellar protein FliS
MNEMNHPYARYKKQSVSTMTPGEIVVALYSETEKQLNRSIHFIQSKDYENANNALNKAYDVVSGLRSMLDMRIEISANLDSLYDFFMKQILTANTKKDANIVQELLPMIGELKDAFVQISTMPKTTPYVPEQQAL